MRDEIRCVHCGKVLDSPRLNPWLSSLDKPAYEHWCAGAPACDAGITWYEENTVKTIAGRMVFADRDDAVREQRKALACPTR
jgi:hypothetical protein